MRSMDSSATVLMDIMEHTVKMVCIMITMSTEIKALKALIILEVCMHSRLGSVYKNGLKYCY